MVHGGVGANMTDQLCGIEIAKAFEHPVTTFAVCVAKRMPEGPATILLLVVLVCCTAAVPFIIRYYAGLVGQGAAPEGTPERQDYDKLRASLAEGNFAARLIPQFHCPPVQPGDSTTILARPQRPLGRTSSWFRLRPTWGS
jgi:hypothetical protein